ncbi:Protein DSF2 [Smittium culicis]|uniref:Protein DSF2 n=1 Tax=Smittium culicis TaxID=133412 RepID=A0A1R1XXX5_9FUNG|nr:Protein DSF2 [Smittium culicis]
MNIFKKRSSNLSNNTTKPPNFGNSSDKNTFFVKSVVRTTDNSPFKGIVEKHRMLSNTKVKNVHKAPRHRPKIIPNNIFIKNSFTENIDSSPYSNKNQLSTLSHHSRVDPQSITLEDLHFKDTSSYHSIDSIEFSNDSAFFSGNSETILKHNSDSGLRANQFSMTRSLAYESISSDNFQVIEELPPSFKRNMLKLNKDITKKKKASDQPLLKKKRFISESERYFDLALHFHDSNELKMAAAYYKKSADLKHPPGNLFYGLCLRHGWGVKESKAQSLIYIQNSVELLLNLGSSELNKFEFARVKNDLPMAIYELGQSFFQGWGVPKNTKVGLGYFNISAELGYPEAIIDLAICYENGIALKRNLKQAAHYYRLAHSKGISFFGNSWIFKDKYLKPPIS